MKSVISMFVLDCIWTIARRILLLILVLILLCQVVTGQEVTNEPFLPAMPSLIDGDSCTPPCWFGLQAGKSTSEDVLRMFYVNADLFWNEFVEVGHTSDGLPVVDLHLNLQSLLEDGAIAFYWSNTDFRAPTTRGSVIRLVADQVEAMEIEPNKTISLDETLQQLGQPNLIRAEGTLYEDFILLYYHSPYLIIKLTNYWNWQDCKIAELLETFEVEYIYYLSPITYREEARSWLQSTSYVPGRVWNSWTAGEIEDSCTVAISSLRN